MQGAPGSRPSAFGVIGQRYEDWYNEDRRVTVVPVILSGGTGTRLWPLSREGYPKQFWPLVSERTDVAGNRGPGRRPRLRPADRGLQRGASLHGRRAVARGGDRRRPHPPGAGGPQQRPGHRRRRAFAARGRPDFGALDDGRRRRDRRCAGAACGLGPGGGGGAGRAGSSPSACGRPRRRPGMATSRWGESCPEAPGVHAVAHFVEKPDAARPRRASWPMGGISGTAACSWPPPRP